MNFKHDKTETCQKKKKKKNEAKIEKCVSLIHIYFK